LLVKFRHLEEWTLARQRNADHYDRLIREAGLADSVAVPFRAPGYRHVFNQYMIRVQRRDSLRAHLSTNGVGTEIYYPVPLHAQQCFGYLGHEPQDFPASLAAASEVLALPIYPELTAAQREYVVEQIAAFCRH
jgi:dTDP-4-amino-4,6-dideoxygalactose transaminase